jgi:hypothetical protein
MKGRRMETHQRYLQRVLMSLFFQQFNVHTVRRTLTLYSPAVTVRTARFNIQQFCVLPIQCIYVFCVDLRTNSGYFPIQH